MKLAKLRSDISYNDVGKWATFGIASLIAIIIAKFSFDLGSTFNMLIIAMGFGLVMVSATFIKIEIGYYSIIFFGFLVGSLDRIFLSRFPFISIILMISILLLLLLFIKEIGGNKDFSWISWHPLIYCYFFTTVYMIVEIFNPDMESFLGWISAFWQRIAYTAFLFIALYILKDLSRVRFFFKCILGAVFITALYGCIQQWHGLSSFDMRWVYSDPHIYGLFSLPGGGLRKFSFFSDPANFGTFMAASAGGTLIFLIRGKFTLKQRIMVIFFALIIVLGMSYSGTRTGNITLFASLGIYILMTLYQKRTQFLALIAVFSFLAIMYVPIYGNVTLNRFRSAFSTSDDASLNVRLVHREMFQPYMHRHPFGGGINTAGAGGAKYNPHHFLAGFPPDGAYFAVALQQGWIGLAINCIFDFLIISFCVHYFYKCKNEEIKTYYAVMVAVLFALFLGAYAQYTITSVPQSFVFISFLALIAKLHTFDTPKLSKTNS